MCGDLSDAKAAVDWAVSQRKSLAKRIGAWRQNRPYSVRIDTNSEPGKKLYRLTNIKPLDPLINAETGAIIHSIRSSLDLLSCTLAARNGFPNSTSTYFPIWRSEVEFLAPHGRKSNPVLEKIKRLSDLDQTIIKDLKPYPGGSDLLCALHDLDLTRKHRRMLNAFVFPRGIGFAGFPIGCEKIIPDWQGFDEETVLLITDGTVPDGNVTIGLHVAFDEIGPMHGQNFAGTLSEFARLAYSIIDLFC